MPSVTISDQAYEKIQARAKLMNTSIESVLDDIILENSNLVDKSSAISPDKLQHNELLQVVVDGLTNQIALIDTNGTIVMVNRAWRDFANENGGVIGAVSEGVNYLDVCDNIIGDDQADATSMASDIRQVISGQSTIFEQEYPCHSPTQQRWYRAIVTPFPREDPQYILVVHENITKRKLAQQALQESAFGLRQSETRYRAIIDNFPSGIVALFDHDLRLTLVGGEGLGHFGWKYSELEGKHIRDILPTEIYEQHEAVAVAALRGERTENIIPFQGMTFRVISLPVFDDEGNVVSGLGIIQNITELVATQSELKESLQHLELAINTAKVGIWSIDVKTRKLDWNNQMFEIYGITADEFGHSVDDYYARLHPDDREYADARFDEIMTIGSAKDVKVRIIQPSGEIRHVIGSGAAIYDNGGNIIKQIGINIDITQQIEAEATLRDTFNQLQLAVETAKLGIWSIDLKTERLDWNQQMYEMYGVTEEDFKHNRISTRAMAHPDDLELLDQQFADISNKGHISNVNFRIFRPNGELRHIRTSGLAIHDENGEPIKLIGINEDITAQVLAQQTLNETFDQLQLAIATSQLGLWSIDIPTERVYWSGQTCAIYGIVPSNFDHRQATFLDAIHPDDRIHVDKRFADIYNDGYISQVDFRIIRPDGEIRHVRLSGTLIHDSLGNPTKQMGFVIDLTEQVEHEQALKQTFEQLQLAVDTANLGVWTVDNGTDHVDWNSHMFEIYGIIPEEFDNQLETTQRMVHPDDEKYVVTRYLEIIENGSISNMSYRILRPSGEIRYLITSAVTVHDTEGKPIKIIGICIDVTEYEVAKHEIEASKVRYENLFQGAINPIGVLTENAHFLMINAEGAKRLGAPVEQFIGKPVGDFIPNSQTTMENRIQEVLQSKQAHWYEDFVKIANHNIWVRSVIQPIITEKIRLKSVQVIAYDVTDRKQAEKIEQERAKLKIELEQELELSRQRSKMLTTLSHELRTPLAILSSASEVLSRHFDRLDVERRQQKFERITNQVHHLSNLLDEIHKLAEADRGFLGFSPAHTDVRKMCENLIDELNDTIETDHYIERALTLQSDEFVLDEQLIVHALTNLINNAIKYSPDGGEVHVSVIQFEHNLQFRVTDHGIGIPEADQAKLLAPFVRASNVGTIRGTGIGLSLVKEIMDFHHGTIMIESTLGKGSTFILTMPLDLTVADENDTD